MTRRFVALFLLSLSLNPAAGAQTPAPRKPAPAPATASRSRNIDAAKIEQLRARMKSFVDRGRAAGIVTLVAHRGQIVDLSAVGMQDAEAQTPMKTDAIFQIASMTKPVTAVGIMLLAEDGLLAITDPVQKYLPKFADLQLLTKTEDGELQEVRKPARAITIRDLLTHTSGMGGGYPEPIKGLFDARDRTLAEAVDLFPLRPLEFEPGSRWGYSNMGIATLGRIIEVVSGKSYEEFIAERIFAPLGMKDSHFFLPEEKRDRVAVIYRFEGNSLSRSDVSLHREGAKYPAPEAGMYSTAQDLHKFYQMMLNGGTLNGRRVLSRATVELMTRVHTGELTAGFSPGMGFGLGWAVVRNVAGTFRLNSIGTYGHGGLYHTYGFIDPQKELIGVILFQRLSSDGDMADEFSAFLTMAAAAVIY